ncbi:MAG: glutathione S-transferase family protein [Deltaproteobacteria bacterium]|nr:glutathione S-transferase family protein [Deltaproteobacteria bacterium]
MQADDRWVLWGSELSPFALKVEALLRFARVTFRWLPASGNFFDAFRLDRRRRRVVAGRLPLTWPRTTELDEFPLVPFLFGPAGENLYDSSAIALWLDRRHANSIEYAPLLPTTDPALRFAIRLIDEALDEVGLYLVHHNRWVVSARDNDAGARLAREMRPRLGPLAPLVGHFFPARQVRRLPYLFSVAPADAGRYDDLPVRLRPPTRAGVPPTHDLLEQAFSELLTTIEPVLSHQPYLFGARFTLADASLYGQLGMNRSDPSARAWISRDAPATQAWIDRIAQGDFHEHRRDGELFVDGALAPLLDWICRTFVPLMRQNHTAWQRHRAAGETRFNEAAFNAGRALYDGTLLGRPFRSVAKTFQVRVWRDLRAEWDALGMNDRARLETLLPAAHGLDRDGLMVSTQHPRPSAPMARF